MPRLDHRKRRNQEAPQVSDSTAALFQWLLHELNILRTALHLPPLTREEAQTSLRHTQQEHAPTSAREGEKLWRN